MRKKVWDTMGISFDILRSHEFESYTVFQNWLGDSIDYLNGAKRDFKSKSYKLSLRRLQLAVETLIKSYAIYIGLRKEKSIKNGIKIASKNYKGDYIGSICSDLCLHLPLLSMAF